MNKQAFKLYNTLKNKESSFEDVSFKLEKFENYLTDLCHHLRPNGYKDKFIYHWTFKDVSKLENCFDNYAKTNIISAKNSLTRLKEVIDDKCFTSVTKRLLTDFVCDLKPLIKKFDDNQDYSWLIMNTNSHSSNFYYDLSNNLFLYGHPGTHSEEKLILSSSTPFIIRQSIEYKIKRVLGIDYWLVNGNPDRKMLTKCFKAIKSNKKYYRTREFDFEVIKEIYSWCNYYIHGGYRPEPWKTETALYCLKNLFYKGKSSSSNLYSLYAGVEVFESDLLSLKNNTKRIIIDETHETVKIKWLNQPEVAIIKDA